MKHLIEKMMVAAIVGAAVLTPVAVAQAPWAKAQLSCADKIKADVGEGEMKLVERKELSGRYKFVVKVTLEDEVLVTCTARKRNGDIQEFSVEAIES